MVGTWNISESDDHDNCTYIYASKKRKRNPSWRIFNFLLFNELRIGILFRFCFVTHRKISQRYNQTIYIISPPPNTLSFTSLIMQMKHLTQLKCHSYRDYNLSYLIPFHSPWLHNLQTTVAILCHYLCFTGARPCVIVVLVIPMSRLHIRQLTGGSC